MKNIEDENPQKELESIVRKAEELISCDNKKCEMRGEYWKCYTGNERKCSIYLNYIVKHERR